ncbi:MAG: polysaccharide deacetylase family protein [Candidatus Sumerlaeaceae bacterium]|nr:polysaccharide deacetylase family protein [Candidatus Sumerlaeaceae bacterium]
MSKPKSADGGRSPFEGSKFGASDDLSRGELFVHVDLDDVWAIGECYGINIPRTHQHVVYEEGVPRLLSLFDELKVRATLFVCGKDLEHGSKVEMLRECLRRGHHLANHGWSHNLSFRKLEAQHIEEEIVRTHSWAEDALGVNLRGFRAPGYAWSINLLSKLAQLGYLYDSSLMPSPFGGVLRFLDARITKLVRGNKREKTQYPLLGDGFRPLKPFLVCGNDGACIWELPVGVGPWLRLPFQASVCLQVGPSYFHFVEALLALSGVSPFVFLLHGADATDFSGVTVSELKRLRYFQMPIEERMELLRLFLGTLVRKRCVHVSEEWFEHRNVIS